jgi:hypothetical protein
MRVKNFAMSERMTNLQPPPIASSTAWMAAGTAAMSSSLFFLMPPKRRIPFESTKCFQSPIKQAGEKQKSHNERALRCRLHQSRGRRIVNILRDRTVFYALDRASLTTNKGTRKDQKLVAKVLVTFSNRRVTS